MKFQMHYADYESSSYEKFRVKFSKKDKSRFDYWKRTSFTKEEWIDIKQYCEELNCEFLCTPFSLHAIDVLMDIGVKRFKVGSAEAIDSLFLKYIGSTQKDIILSTGLINNTDFEDYYNKIGNLFANNNLTFLHCISEYPSNPQSWNLSNIESMRNITKK